MVQKGKTIKVWDKKTKGKVSFTPSPTKIVRITKQGGLVEEIPMNRRERRKAGIR